MGDLRRRGGLYDSGTERALTIDPGLGSGDGRSAPPVEASKTFEEGTDSVGGTSGSSLRHGYQPHARLARAPAIPAEQKHTLSVALEMGYFEFPREASLPEVAETLDIEADVALERLIRSVGSAVRAVVEPRE